MKITRIIALSSIIAFASPMALAEKPQWAGKGKPDLEEIKTRADVDKAQLELEGQEEDLKQLIEEKKNKANKAKSKKDKNKLKRELEELEDQQDDLEEYKQKLKNKKSGLEKQKEKKAYQVQNELGKGSEKGQAQREENSKKWWKFWE